MSERKEGTMIERKERYHTGSRAGEKRRRRLQNGEDIWTVYGLTDPRSNGHVFYVGMAVDLNRRYQDHHTNPKSYAREWCRDIVDSGEKVGFCIFGQFHEKKLAEFLEKELIIILPQLTNNQGYKDGRDLWEKVQRVFR